MPDDAVRDPDGRTYQEYCAGRDPEFTLTEETWNTWALSQADDTPSSPAPTGIIAGKDDTFSLEKLGINTVPEFKVIDDPEWDRHKLWREFTPVTDKRSTTKWLGGDLSNAVFANVMLEPLTKLNEYTRKTEYRGRPLEDTDITRLRLNAMDVASLHSGGEYSPTAATFREAVLFVAHHRRYNPAIEALDNLEWDGYPRLDRLGDFLDPVNHDRLNQEVMKLIVMGVVARTYQPGYKFDYMPIIVGSQGAAKGLWLQSLAVVDGAVSYTHLTLPTTPYV